MCKNRYISPIFSFFHFFQYGWKKHISSGAVFSTEISGFFRGCGRNCQPCFKLCVSFRTHWWFQIWVTVRKRPIWVKCDDFLSRVTLTFDGWPWKTIGHLFYATSSFVQHFVSIGEFKLELQSGNAQSGSNSTFFSAVWPWNLTDDLQKQ